MKPTKTRTDEKDNLLCWITGIFIGFIMGTLVTGFSIVISQYLELKQVGII